MDLTPEMIYVDPDSFQCSFCLVPGGRWDFSQGFRELSQYLLDHVDHRDGEAVVLAFAIFRESRKENFGLEEIESVWKRPGQSQRLKKRRSGRKRGLQEPYRRADRNGGGKKAGSVENGYRKRSAGIWGMDE